MKTINREFIIKDTHRGLWYEDGVLTRVLEAGRYEVPTWNGFGPFRRPQVDVTIVDVRERDLTIKGQEILTADKVAIRVSIIVQFRVTDPKSALHQVDRYEERLYSDVQLAARRALAAMTLEEILTNRHRLSEEILADVKESAATYGVAIFRADVKDLVFPGNLQEIMNKVLTAERLSQAQLVEARTKAETEMIAHTAKLRVQKEQAETLATLQKLTAETEAEATRVRTEADVAALKAREESAQAYTSHPSLLRLRELETLKELAKQANARIYIDFDRRQKGDAEGD